MNSVLPPRPSGWIFEPIEHLAGFGHIQNAFVLTILVVRDLDRPGITIAEINGPADVLGDLRRQRHLDTWLLDAVDACADPAHVGGVRQDAPRLILETRPLLQEIIARVVTDALDERAMRQRKLANVRSVDDQLAA